MKRLFARISLKPPPNPNAGTTLTEPVNVPKHAHPVGLQPSLIVPPVPHPHPHAVLELSVSSHGIVLRPHGVVSAGKSVCVRWGKPVQVEEVDGVEWDGEGAVLVYGIVGVLELFSGSYLLVITSRKDAGHLLDPAHTVYNVTGVIAVPLVSEERARVVVNTLAARKPSSRPPLPRDETLDYVAGPPSSPPSSSSHLSSASGDSVASEDGAATPAPRTVTFAPDDDVKVLTPQVSTFASTSLPNGSSHSEPLSPTSSGASTPTTETGTTPLAKTLAARLSFWSRLAKRVPTPVPTSTPPPAEIDAMMDSEIEPKEVLESILEATAPAPASPAAQNNELEERVVREVVRAFGRGAMWVAYTFDLTRSLQAKQRILAQSKRTDKLLRDLDVLELPSQDRGRKLKKNGRSKSKDNTPSSPSPIPTSPSHPVRPSLSSTSTPSTPTTPATPATPATPSSSTSIKDPPREDEDAVDASADPHPALPLWRRVDRQFWWNEWLARPFVEAGLHRYVLPLMQGHFQAASFSANDAGCPTDEDVRVEYTVISRRSRDRAGLRYQRRGADGEAHVANFVETESVLSVEREGRMNIFGHVQIRGSIPLYWTQTGYGLKPPPVLDSNRTHDQQLDVVRRHFTRTVPRYGPHTIVNLAEQRGKEGSLTTAYREYATELGSVDAKYCEYDFHTETKGMKYENISKLIDAMERTFEHQGYLWISGNSILTEQKGVFRVNCIDCLDRTNVVQSAFARHVMNRQLGAVALTNEPSQVSRTDADIVFNDVWANNGDAISRAYAGTSALKGDFTRTGKRDLGGMLNDGVNSLARMYTSTFSDWFSQAVIDFMLGYRSLSVFSEFLLKLQSTDPRDLIRISNIRAEAIATSVARVLAEGERLLSGWTLFSPAELNTKMADKFEEKVLLLTVQAIYIVSYDYTLEKVILYTRIPLSDVVGVSKGAYIISPLEEASRDPLQNAGFVLTWTNTRQTSRATTYSVRNNLQEGRTSSSIIPRPATPPTRPSPPARKSTRLSRLLINTSAILGTNSSDTSFAAFKALPIDPARVRRGEGSGFTEPADELTGASTCREAVEFMVDSIHRACLDAGVGRSDFVSEADVVSLEEAQRMTTVYAKMEYGIKRLLWLGAS